MTPRTLCSLVALLSLLGGARGALHRMRADGSLTELLAYSHSRTHCGAKCDYCSLPRPAQSPDGTKVGYTSDMLHATENIEDLYVVVHRYPFAPVWLGLVAPEELRLTWRLHSLAREIRGVRVLRRADVSPPSFEPAPTSISRTGRTRP